MAAAYLRQVQLRLHPAHSERIDAAETWLGFVGDLIYIYPDVAQALAMKFFFIKLIPPRADFMATMTPQERDLMLEHQAYWRGFMEKGWAIAYGPVMHPEGGFGAGFWALPDDQPPEPLTAHDPVIKASKGFRYEISPMPGLVVGNANNRTPQPS